MTADDVIRVIDTVIEHHTFLIGLILVIWACK